MAAFLIKDARPYHCGQIARLLRYDHRHVACGLNLNCHAELKARFDESAFRKAWFIDGMLSALGGVTGTALAPCGHVWLAVSEGAARHFPVAMVKEARRQLAEIMMTRQQLTTTVFEADLPSVRFATALGFKGIAYGKPYWLMEYRRESIRAEAA